MSAKQRWVIIIIIITISLKDITTVLMPLLTPYSSPLVSYFPRSGCDRPSLATLGSLYPVSPLSARHKAPPLTLTSRYLTSSKMSTIFHSAWRMVATNAFSTLKHESAYFLILVHLMGVMVIKSLSRISIRPTVSYSVLIVS